MFVLDQVTACADFSGQDSRGKGVSAVDKGVGYTQIAS